MRRECPDEGKCHHDCGEGSCFRVVACAPLTMYGEDWTDEDYANNRPEGLRPSIDSVIAGVHRV